MTKKPTAKRVRDLLIYDPDSGCFWWRKMQHNRTYPGRRAGWIERKGYVRVCIDGKNYQAHRLAWLYMTGKWPVDQIDHANGRKDDNRFVNLRECNNSQNGHNRGLMRSNTSGIKGVYWHKRLEKWYASISVEGRLRTLGYRASREAAAKLYTEAAQKYFGEFARTS